MNEYLKVMPLWVVILLWIDSKRRKKEEITVKDKIDFFVKLGDFTTFNIVKLYCANRIRGLLTLRSIGVVRYGVLSFVKSFQNKVVPIQLTLFNMDEYVAENYFTKN